MIPVSLYLVANHLWQSTLFAAVAALSTLALRKNRAQARYWLWFAASMKFLVPFSLLVNLGAQLGSHRIAPPNLPALSYLIDQASQPFTLPVAPASTPVRHQSASLSWVPAALCVLWIAGSAAILLSWVRRGRILRAAVRTATTLHQPIGIPAVTSPAFSEPAVFGVFWPVLLLPAGIADRLTPAEFQAIVAHELCHVRRRDNLTSALHMAVEAIFWFHPLVWWLGARLLAERERACDEEVLLLGNEPQVYAEGILKICELSLEPPLPCISGVTGSNLKRRIEEIMSRRIGLPLAIGKKSALTGAGLIVLAVPVTLGTLNAPALQAQSSTTAQAKFEVVSVRVDKNSSSGPAVRMTPGRLNAENLTVRGLISIAYKVRRSQISGGPGWINTEKYSIDAKTDGNNGADLMLLMLQSVLDERFHFRFHHETKEGALYELTIGKGGSKMGEATCVPFDPNNLPKQATLSDQERRRQCGGISRRAGELDGDGMSLEDATGPAFQSLAGQLSLILERPVINRTGLTGRFDIHLRWNPEQETTSLQNDPGNLTQPLAVDSSGPSLFTALQEQLGLKLTPSKGPVDFLVIDQIERPSDN
ncbi:MAG: TIGR03435 family protein [Acidobacteriia bacterium]|nr:TIGR03435 family protein [Terriglobia bacterium]